MPKLVSIIIPCRNEEKFIAACLDSILAQDYPGDRIEILVMNGMSADKTAEVVLAYVKKFPSVKLLDNPKKIAPTALNIGIRSAKGDVIIRLDAHSEYPKDYVSKCIRYQDEYKADNVGGVWITRAQKADALGEAIVFVLSHKFGVGNSLFRVGVKEPVEADTVPFGCYRREVFERIGLFNEHLVRNQDIEFNLRLRKAGGKIFLVPDIVSYYYARSSLKDLARNNFRNGFWVLYSMKFAPLPFSVRHLAPFAFVLTLLVTLLAGMFWAPAILVSAFVLAVYMMFTLAVSVSIAREKGARYFLSLAVSFWTLHFSYGLGSLCGLIRLVF